MSTRLNRGGEYHPRKHLACNPQFVYRIAGLEMLDEIEEMDLVLRHYAITWGLLHRSPSIQWDSWGLKSSARMDADE